MKLSQTCALPLLLLAAFSAHATTSFSTTTTVSTNTPSVSPAVVVTSSLSTTATSSSPAPVLSSTTTSAPPVPLSSSTTSPFFVLYSSSTTTPTAPLYSSTTTASSAHDTYSSTSTKTFLGAVFSSNTLFHTTTTTSAATAAPTVSRSADGFPIPDPNYNSTSSGPVTILMLDSQSSSPYGSYVAQSATHLTASTVNNNNKLKIDIKSFPPGTTYDTYLSQVRTACDEKLGGLFDVVMLEATVLGDLADCLVDLGEWEAGMGAGFAARILQNSLVNKRLVSLPTEADIGVLYFNADMLGKYASENLPTSLDEIESIAGTVLTAQRAIDNYGFSGYTGQFSGEDLTAQVAEWLYGANRSAILNSTTGLVNLETNSVASVLQRVSTWTSSNIIDPNDFLFPPAERFSNAVTRGLEHPDSALVDVDPSLARFVAGNSLFLRHWSSTYAWLYANPQVMIRWGVGPLPGWNHDANVGALGGWGVGVYKYSKNPAAAVKVAKWLASREMQRGAVVQGKHHVVPTRSDLYNDTAVCNIIGSDICGIYASATPALRPSSLSGRNYKNISNLVSSRMTTFFTTELTIVDALTELTTDIARVLNQTRLNNTNWSIDPAPAGKKVPSHLQIQLMGLCAVILITCTAIYLLKRRQIDDGIASAKDKLTALAVTAKQEVLNKTVRGRPDLEFGANEFTHLDDDDEEEELVKGSRGNSARPKYSIVKGAEKDDFI
ncbi:hypothetical protein BC830DRAFT_1088603 [Chytriomyces sp. MP71]|nr:hypothetical protein BC830DRAFT_1088603 [Chytriomyces sp. MP71]